MDGNAKLAHTTLSKSLNVACKMFAYYRQNETGEITAEQIASLPDVVFNLAVGAGWLPEPTDQDNWSPLTELDADHVWLGNFVVHPTFRQQFVALLSESLSEIEPWSREIELRHRHEEFQNEIHLDQLRQAAEEYHSLATRPSPKEVIERWLTENSRTVEELAELADVGVATIYRIKKGEFDYSRNPESLKNVAAVIGCDWRDLLPLSG